MITTLTCTLNLSAQPTSPCPCRPRRHAPAPAPAPPFPTLEPHDYSPTHGRLVTLIKPAVKKRHGVSEDIVRRISWRNNEPDWMLQFRLEAFHEWLLMESSEDNYILGRENFSSMDFGAMWSDDPGVQHEAGKLSTNLVMGQLRDGPIPDIDRFDADDSFAGTHKKALDAAGVIFCAMSEAVHRYPDLVRAYLGKVVAAEGNYYAALNSAVFQDGSFCYVPRDTVCPMDISTHYMAKYPKVASPFERHLIVCDENSYVSSLGCTSPPNSNSNSNSNSPRGHASQAYAPVVELHCAAGGEIKHFTVANWNHEEAGVESPPQVFNFVTQRGLCAGAGAKITWMSVEAGSAVTWQHPEVVLKGDGSVGECYSVTLTDSGQQADTGATMVHLGCNTRSRIVAKSVSGGVSQSWLGSRICVDAMARNARSESQGDAILLGEYAEFTSRPSVVARNTSAQIEQKGSTSRLSKELVFYFQQRGIPAEKAVPAILTGFCNSVLRELPQEFETEVKEMVEQKMEKAMKAC